MRLKVTCLRSLEVKQEEQQVLKVEARLYVDQAYRYAIELARPTLWVFCGLPATGKSSLAKQIAKALSIPLFQSDRIRQERQPGFHQEVLPFGQGLYGLERRHRVYAQLLAMAQETLKGGHSVILDGTYSHRRWRDDARLLASDLDTNIVFVECLCKEETLRSRLKQRAREPSLSDARLQHFPQMVEDFEPLIELAPEIHVTISTEQPLRDAVARVLSEGYASKCAQVKTLL